MSPGDGEPGGDRAESRAPDAAGSAAAGRRAAAREDDLRVLPASPERWQELEELFGERGACGGCWCMYWRLPRAEFERGKGAPNRAGLRALVASGDPPGLIAYLAGRPVGWCSVGPRDAFPRLERSRILRPVDDAPVWSVVCLFVARPFRGRGVSVALLRAAAEHAASHGAGMVEGYPVDPRRGRVPDAFAWTGIEAGFRRAGFREVARRSEGRPIMRRQASRPA